ncbi:hypothetical protein [Candidatus Sororendozoicomonas aggregata]|uniref:hypothetical protein n=1 Tax=Candidatus Sororendozoicomonas aggregata TaxID=3073239 RepID=UPI002ED5802F
MLKAIRFLYLLLLMMLPVTVLGAVKGRLTVLEGNASVRMIFDREASDKAKADVTKMVTSFYHSADDDLTWGDPGGLAYNQSPQKLRKQVLERLKQKLGEEDVTFTQVVVGIAGFEKKDEIYPGTSITREAFHKENYAVMLGVDPDSIHMISDSDLVAKAAEIYAKNKKNEDNPLVLQLTTFAYGYTINGKGGMDYYQHGRNGASWQFGASVYSDKDSTQERFAKYREDLIKFINEKLHKTVDTKGRLLSGHKRMNVLGYLSMQLARKDGISKETKTYLAEKEALLIPPARNVAGQLASSDLEEKKPLIMIAGAEYFPDIQQQFEGKLLPASSHRTQLFCQGNDFLISLDQAGAAFISQPKAEVEAPGSH